VGAGVTTLSVGADVGWEVLGAALSGVGDCEVGGAVGEPGGSEPVVGCAVGDLDVGCAVGDLEVGLRLVG